MTGTAFKQARLGRGIKQSFIAEKLGMQASNLATLEASDKPMRLTYAQWMLIKDLLNLDDIQMGVYE